MVPLLPSPRGRPALSGGWAVPTLMDRCKTRIMSTLNGCSRRRRTSWRAPCKSQIVLSLRSSGGLPARSISLAAPRGVVAPANCAEAIVSARRALAENRSASWRSTKSPSAFRSMSCRISATSAATLNSKGIPLPSFKAVVLRPPDRASFRATHQASRLMPAGAGLLQMSTQ